MNKDKILKELHEKVNAWFEEKPQRPIAQFMLDTMLPYIEAVEHGVHPTAFGVFAAVFFFGFCCGAVAFNAICGGG